MSPSANKYKNELHLLGRVTGIPSQALVRNAVWGCCSWQRLCALNLYAKMLCWEGRNISQKRSGGLSGATSLRGVVQSCIPWILAVLTLAYFHVDMLPQ